MFTLQEKKYMLDLARRSIGHYLATGKILEVDENEAPSALTEERACFVTLTIGGQLRGCIGHILATQPLYKDIAENAASAAFGDPRFNPVTEAELEKLAIEISVLSQPRPLEFSSPEDLLAKLRPRVDGVIIRRGPQSATYLPQVWEELSDKKEFLSSLCVKAGLPPDDWTKKGLEVKVYEAEEVV